MKNSIICLANYREAHAMLNNADTKPETPEISHDLANAIQELILHLRNNQPLSP